MTPVQLLDALDALGPCSVKRHEPNKRGIIKVEIRRGKDITKGEGDSFREAMRRALVASG